MWELPEYPGPCFDFHFDRFEGLMFETEKTLGKRVRRRGLPSCGSIFSTFVRFHSLSHRILLLSLSMNLCSSSMSCAVGWSGCVRKKRNGNHFFGVENSKKKSEERGQKLARNSDPFLVPLSIGTFPEGSENGRIFGPAFWCRRATFELVFGSVQSGRGATISSARCIRITPKCSQLLLVLNTHSFQTIKLGRPLVVHRFLKSFSVSKMGPSNRTKAECRNRVQEKTKFGKKCGKTPAATPSPFHIPKPAKTQS